MSDQNLVEAAAMLAGALFAVAMVFAFGGRR